MLNWKVAFILFWIFTLGGAIMEHLAYYFSTTKKALANPIITGFPLYGFAGLSILYLNELLGLDKRSWILRFLLYGIWLSLVEFLVGMLVGAGHANTNGLVESWDYSKNRFNIDGKVDLFHSFVYGILGFVVSIVNYRLNNTISQCFRLCI